MKDERINRINIRPGVSILSVLPHLNYRPWFALAEFVDNSIQSFQEYRGAIAEADGPDVCLKVEIDIDQNDGGSIIIRDNAAGIHDKDFARAFRPAALPTDRSGLCEFGMGMKSAACWFAPIWTARTAAIGESIEKKVRFDIRQIVRDEIEELEVDTRSVDPKAHYTEIVLANLNVIPHGRTITKIKDHLRDIYRVFTRRGDLFLFLNGEPLLYEAPDILVAPFYRLPDEPPVEWRKEFEFDFGLGLKAKGFAAIRKTASTTRAGFALFRRNRLIQGSADEGYRPEFIFGSPNTFIFQRVFGEIHLQGFDVSHTKDGFKWDENEQSFLELLKEELNSGVLPLLQQAREHRVQRQPHDFHHGAKAATSRTAQTIHDHIPPVIEDISRMEGTENNPEDTLQEAAETPSRHATDVELNGKKWRIVIELTYDPAIGDWLSLSDHIAEEGKSKAEEDGYRIIGLRMSLAHPFMERFSGTDCEQIEPLLRLAAALGLAEVVARDSGVKMAGTIRRNVNELLRNALWHT